MENSKCILTKKDSLKTAEAIKILEAPECYTTISTPPCKPKAGEMYLFDLPEEKAGIGSYLDVNMPTVYLFAICANNACT